MNKATRRQFIQRTVALAGSIGCVSNGSRLLAADGHEISFDAIERFRAKIKGRLVLPGDSLYEDARRVFYWNPRTESRPAAVVQCGHEEDALRAIEFARHHELEVAVRAG